MWRSEELRRPSSMLGRWDEFNNKPKDSGKFKPETARTMNNNFEFPEDLQERNDGNGNSNSTQNNQNDDLDDWGNLISNSMDFGSNPNQHPTANNKLKRRQLLFNNEPLTSESLVSDSLVSAIRSNPYANRVNLDPFGETGTSSSSNAAAGGDHGRSSRSTSRNKRWQGVEDGRNFARSDQMNEHNSKINVNEQIQNIRFIEDDGEPELNVNPPPEKMDPITRMLTKYKNDFEAGLDDLGGDEDGNESNENEDGDDNNQDGPGSENINRTDEDRRRNNNVIPNNVNNVIPSNMIFDLDGENEVTAVARPDPQTKPLCNLWAGGGAGTVGSDKEGKQNPPSKKKKGRIKKDRSGSGWRKKTDATPKSILGPGTDFCAKINGNTIREDHD
jgi:hypothetical protein